MPLWWGSAQARATIHQPSRTHFGSWGVGLFVGDPSRDVCDADRRCAADSVTGLGDRGAFCGLGDAAGLACGSDGAASSTLSTPCSVSARCQQLAGPIP